MERVTSPTFTSPELVSLAATCSKGRSHNLESLSFCLNLLLQFMETVWRSCERRKAEEVNNQNATYQLIYETSSIKINHKGRLYPWLRPMFEALRAEQCATWTHTRDALSSIQEQYSTSCAADKLFFLHFPQNASSICTSTCAVL